jgi:hypothetical protein
MRAMEKKLME